MAKERTTLSIIKQNNLTPVQLIFLIIATGFLIWYGVFYKSPPCPTCLWYCNYTNSTFVEQSYSEGNRGDYGDYLPRIYLWKNGTVTTVPDYTYFNLNHNHKLSTEQIKMLEHNGLFPAKQAGLTSLIDGDAACTCDDKNGRRFKTVVLHEKDEKLWINLTKTDKGWITQ